MYSSDSSVEVASKLGRLGVPSVSPSASSTKLNDRKQYPTFYRTVPADDKQAGGISKLLGYMGWKYVQTLNSPDTYGRTGVEALQGGLSSETCTSASYEFETDGTPDAILAKLLTSSTNIVVVFAGADYITKLIEAKTKAGQPAKNLVFITTETVQDMAGTKDTLAFAVDAPTVQAFSSYLEAKMPNDYTANPWFREYYQVGRMARMKGISVWGKLFMHIGT